MEIGKVEVVLALGGDVLDQADGVVADQAHGAAGEGGQVRIVHGAVAVQELLEFLQGIGLVVAASLPPMEMSRPLALKV